MCQASTAWSGDDPSCLIRMCPAVKDPQDGDVSMTKGTEFGSTISFKCDRGYGIVGGKASAKCVEDVKDPTRGKWSAAPFPTCKIKDCGILSPPQVVGGRKQDAPASFVSYYKAGSLSTDHEADALLQLQGTTGTGHSTTTYGAFAEFSCHKGYDLKESTRKSVSVDAPPPPPSPSPPTMHTFRSSPPRLLPSLAPPPSPHSPYSSHSQSLTPSPSSLHVPPSLPLYSPTSVLPL